MESAYSYFENNIKIVEHALKSIKKDEFDSLLNDCIFTLKNNNKIIVSGLGKNVPVCQKFTSMMLSTGLNSAFLDAASALHGDIGMVQDGDLVILLTKSAKTKEITELIAAIEQRSVSYWIITNSEKESEQKSIRVQLEHEGDLWNIIPNNSTTVNLILLQTLAIRMFDKMNLSLTQNFKPNHPGGSIGAILYDEK